MELRLQTIQSTETALLVVLVNEDVPCFYMRRASHLPSWRKGETCRVPDGPL